MQKVGLLVGICLISLGMLSSCAKNPNQGLMASYYNNPLWLGEPMKQKPVDRVDFVWDTEEDKPVYSPFGIVFEGSLLVPESGDITFYLSSDDGSDLTVGGKPVIDNLGYHGDQEKEGRISLPQGWHPIRVRYFDLEGGAQIHLKWLLPDRSSKETIYPRFFRLPDVETGQKPVSPALQGNVSGLKSN